MKRNNHFEKRKSGKAPTRETLVNENGGRRRRIRDTTTTSRHPSIRNPLLPSSQIPCPLSTLPPNETPPSLHLPFSHSQKSLQIHQILLHHHHDGDNLPTPPLSPFLLPEIHLRPRNPNLSFPTISHAHHLRLQSRYNRLRSRIHHSCRHHCISRVPTPHHGRRHSPTFRKVATTVHFPCECIEWEETDLG